MLINGRIYQCDRYGKNYLFASLTNVKNKRTTARSSELSLFGNKPNGFAQRNKCLTIGLEVETSPRWRASCFAVADLFMKHTQAFTVLRGGT